jgi:DNA-binding transcriptional LysR family regulator
VRPDLSSLALFICVAETRSITKAAEKCHIALAAASRRVAQLEHQFGVQLLFRTSRGVEVTPAGSALLFHARRMLEQVDAMRAELSDYSKGAKGMVRVQANTSVLAQWLPEDLATFAARYPEIKVSLEEERSTLIIEAVHSGATDIGIVMEGPPTGGLQCFDYRADLLVAVVAKKHPLRGKRVAFDTLLDYDIAGLESNTAIAQLLAEQAAAAGKPLRLRVQVKGFDVVARMAQAGLGVGILPETAALAFAGPLGLRLVRLTDEWATRRSYVCVRQYSTLAAPARQLVDHLVPRPAS